MFKTNCLVIIFQTCLKRLILPLLIAVGAASQWWSNEWMMVYFKLMMVKCSLMMVKCLLMMVKCSSMMVKCVYDSTLISPSLTSISPSLKSIWPSLAWSKPSFAHLAIIEKLHQLIWGTIFVYQLTGEPRKTSSTARFIKPYWDPASKCTWSR